MKPQLPYSSSLEQKCDDLQAESLSEGRGRADAAAHCGFDLSSFQRSIWSKGERERAAFRGLSVSLFPSLLCSDQRPPSSLTFIHTRPVREGRQCPPLFLRVSTHLSLSVTSIIALREKLPQKGPFWGFRPRVQGSAKRWALGCVNLASWLPLAAGASSRNLGHTF